MTSWEHPGFALPPVAEHIGPFALPSFLAAVEPFEEGEPLMVEGPGAFLPLRVIGDEVRFAGDEELTDYHSPRGDRVEDLIAEVAAAQDPKIFVLDSLPEEAAAPLAKGLARGGLAVARSVHEVAAVLELPSDLDSYLQRIGKKARHEIRRKRRRYEGMVEEVELETHHGTGWAFEEFVRLHRQAEGEKGSFLTDELTEIFAALAGQEGWRLDALRAGETAAAVVFGWSDDTGYYLYNSAYDRALGEASPGVVLLGALIEQAIAEGVSRFDFLKGDEDYKFRLGAERRPLVRLVATREAP